MPKPLKTGLNVKLSIQFGRKYQNSAGNFTISLVNEGCQVHKPKNIIPVTNSTDLYIKRF